MALKETIKRCLPDDLIQKADKKKQWPRVAVKENDYSPFALNIFKKRVLNEEKVRG